MTTVRQSADCQVQLGASSMVLLRPAATQICLGSPALALQCPFSPQLRPGTLETGYFLASFSLKVRSLIVGPRRKAVRHLELDGNACDVPRAERRLPGRAHTSGEPGTLSASHHARRITMWSPCQSISPRATSVGGSRKRIASARVSERNGCAYGS